MPIRNIRLNNVSVSASRGVFVADADGIELNGCRVAAKSGPVMTVIQSRNVTVHGGTFPDAGNGFLKVVGEQSENIRLIGVEPKLIKNGIELGQNVKPEAVKSN